MGEKRNIFKNRFTNSFYDRTIEEEFNKIRIRNTLKWNPLFIILGLSISLVNTIYQILIREEIKQNEFNWINTCFQLSISINVIYSIFLIIVLVVKNRNIQKYLTFLSYIILTLPSFIIRDILYYMKHGDDRGNIYAAIITIEFVLRLWLYYQTMIVFIEGFVCNCICLLVLFIYNPLIHKSTSFETFNLLFVSSISSLTLISYFYNKEMKKYYFVNSELEKKNKWQTSIFNTMNSGFICIKNNKIEFMNHPMIEKIIKNKDIYKILEAEQFQKPERDSNTSFPTYKNTNHKLDIMAIISGGEQICEKILNVLLFDTMVEISGDKLLGNDINSKINNLKTCKNDLQYSDSEIVSNIGGHNDIAHSIYQGNQFNSRNFLSKLKSVYLKKEYNGNFIIIGFKDLEIEETEDNRVIKKIVNFEVNLRFYESNEINKVETFEFIFKDVTRTKTIEEKNAEFKYKTLFLSKVAHEFKNPLICITELVNQIYDKINQDNSDLIQTNTNTNEKISFMCLNKTLTKSLPVIKGLSNYLLILIKDLDFFSQNQIGTNQNFEMSQTDLKEILEFCLEISNGLLKKNNKEKNVSLCFMNDEKLPKKIFTDETKLKQILINLISNAIKFTEHGKIIVKVACQKEGVLKFEIEDTGTGMTDEQKINLFKPYFKSSTNNKVGAGLGLTIVSDLLHKMGSRISYESKLGHGTKFWFDLKCYNTEEELSKLSFIVENSRRHSTKRLISKSLFVKKKISEEENNSVNVQIKQYPSNSSVTKSLKSFSSQETIKKKMTLSFPKHTNSHESTEMRNVNNNYYIENKFIIQNDASRNFSSNNNIERTNSSFEYFSETDLYDKTINYYIVADDEKFTRKSVIRVLYNAAEKLGIKVKFIEAEDGIQTMYIIYKSVIKGVHISAIISDETMKFMTGSKSAQLLKSIGNFMIKKIPFYLTTAYDDLNAIQKLKYVDSVFHKPLTPQDAEKIISSFKNEM
jgi:signal transduction histidine kinase